MLTDVGIVVLNYKEYKVTEKLIDSLISFSFDGNIVIVDNNSQNNSFEILSKKYTNQKIEIVKSLENKGYSFGNNLGIKSLVEKNPYIKYLCIMNPDIEITDLEILEKMRKTLIDNDDIASITGMMYTRNKLNIETCYRDLPTGFDIASEIIEIKKREKANNVKESNNVLRVDIIPGSFFMMKRSVYDQIDGFDENTFLFDEEYLVSLEFKKLGYCCAVLKNYSYNHNHKKRGTTLYNRLKYKTIGFNSRRYMVSTYYGFKERLLLEILIIFDYILIILKYINSKLKYEK